MSSESSPAESRATAAGATGTRPGATGATATGSVETRLQELGLDLPEVAAPVAAYVPALRSGDTIYTSGQLPFVRGALPATGKVGNGAGAVSPAEAKDLARTAVLNGLAAIKQVAGSLDNIAQVIKVMGFVASEPDFTGQPAVINGASELLQDVFGEIGVHARSAVGVAVLPLDSPIEIELVVAIKPV